MRAWAIAALCSMGLFAGCSEEDSRVRSRAGASRFGRRPTSKQALVDAAVRALRGRSGAAYLKLIATVDEVREACPKKFAGRDLSAVRDKWSALERRVRRGVARCSALFSWDKAKRIGLKGGAVEGSLAGCRTPMHRLSSFELSFEQGGRRYRVVLRKPYERRGVYGFAAGPRCTVAEADG